MSSVPDRLDELALRLSRIEAFLSQHGFGSEPSRSEPAHSGPLRSEPALNPPNIASIAAAVEARRALERESVSNDVALARDEPAAALPMGMPVAATVDEVPLTPSGTPHFPPPLPPPLPPSAHGPRLAARAAAASSASASPPSHNLEQAIGLKLAGWIGAVVLVIGGALGVKFAYDQGWFGGMPAEVKLGLLYAISLAIIGLGEWVYRRVAPLAAVGIFGAGIAMLFVVSYAGQAYFNLFAIHTAFGLMAGSCAMGFAIALRGRLVSIAVLSLIGANIAPLILHDTAPQPVSLLVYVLALQLLAVGLAFVGREGRWWTLRTLSLLTTSFWVLDQFVRDESALASARSTILFAVLYAAIFHVENVLSALRPRPAGDERRHWSPSTFSMAVTGALTVAVLALTSNWPGAERTWSDGERSALIAAMALVAVAIGACLLAFKPKSVDAKQLASSAFVQAGTLLVIALAAALAGPWLVLGWAGLALGYAVLGWQIRRPRTTLGGIVVWILAGLYLLARVTDTAEPSVELHRVLFSVNAVPVKVWFAIAVILQCVGHAIAIISSSPRLTNLGGRLPRAMRTLGIVTACVATLGGVVAATSALPPLAASLFLVVSAWLLFGTGRASGRSVYAPLAFGLVVLTCAKWLAVDLLMERFGRDWSPDARTILFNPVIGVGAASVLSLIALARLTESSIAATGDRSRIRGRLVVVCVAIAWMAIGLSIEVERVAFALASHGSTAWPIAQMVAVGQTVVFAVAVLSVVPIGRRIGVDATDDRALRTGIGVALILLAGKFICLDALSFAITGARVAATPIVNLQTVAAAAMVVMLCVATRWNRGTGVGSALRGAIALLPVVIGSIEIDRLVGPDRTLVALSVFWGLYAIATIATGFAVRAKSLRIGGLGLLAVTLAKILLLDLANAGTGWRILSFLGVGAILLATSVLYGKLSPAILGTGRPTEPDTTR